MELAYAELADKLTAAFYLYEKLLQNFYLHKTSKAQPLAATVNNLVFFIKSVLKINILLFWLNNYLRDLVAFKI